MKLAFLINGTAKGLSKLTKTIEDEFSSHSPKLYISDFPGHISKLAYSAVNNGYDTIIICGGDGTLNEGLNGIIDAHKNGIGNSITAYNWQKIAAIKIGVFPAGSGNDFAKTVSISKEIKTLKTLIEQQRSKLIDIGWVSYFNNDNLQAYRFFINITDVGMGGETVLKLQNNKIRALGPDFNYFWAITSTIATYNKVLIKATSENFHWEGKITNFVVANGKYFGNGLCVAPDASIADGKFEIVIIGDISLLDYFKNISKIKSGQKIQHPKVAYYQLESVQIESLEQRNISIDMDGEYIGYAPMKLVNLANKINFICP